MSILTSQAKRWKLIPSAKPALEEKLAISLSVDLQVSRLLVQRGIQSFEEARRFFKPEWSDLHDPFLMKGMRIAIERIKNALENQEGIMIYGDYDVDGTTSVALVYGYLKNSYQNTLIYHIPDRYTEGYGISTHGINVAKENNVSLIIALDCGIRSVDKVAYAQSLGIDFIICDHHLPGNELPEAVAILDPKQDDCTYPYKELSGCGIGFKLIQALEMSYGRDGILPDLLDLVVTSIAADIVPITGENRTLAWFGIEKMNQAPREGLKALLRKKKEEPKNDKADLKEISISDIVFTVAPRINAAGRIDHGKDAVKLLLASSQEAAELSGDIIHVHNTTRKDLDAQITQEALAILQSNVKFTDMRSTVLFKSSWHKGVIGIVASRMIEKVYRPTIILTESNGKATGSARSVKDFDIHDALTECADLLEQFGGHKYAAGMTLLPENIEAFAERFEKVVASRITEEQLIPSIDIDIEVSFAALSPRFYRILKRFAPFGPGNMTPVLMTSHVTDDGNVRIVGANHLKLRISDENKVSFDAIAFGLAEHYEAIRSGIPFDVCYTLEENHWNGRTSLQLVIKDIRF